MRSLVQRRQHASQTPTIAGGLVSPLILWSQSLGLPEVRVFVMYLPSGVIIPATSPPIGTGASFLGEFLGS